jgi:Tol biopolymer transport system component
MPLTDGTRLEHYEILDALGAGGMGEVYRALDTKLRREVALKILPPKFAADPSRLARFEREAHLLAQLNHPNIAAIYGLENADGIRFLVLELVEGQTLSERLKSGPMEVSEALGIAGQIAEAFEAAHDKGVVHRDLKPANVKITPQGKVKVLDFGLAKALGDPEPGGTSGDPANPDAQSTLTLQETKAGVVLGTAAYMSPEQAEGKPTDKRSDVWSFGVVLYEMLSGKRCFEGKTTSHVLVHILEQEPDWQALPASVPPGVRSLLERCLTKDPAERLRDIGDLRVHLRAMEKEATSASRTARVAAVAESQAAAPQVKEAPPASRSGLLWPTIGAAAALAVVVGAFFYFRPKPAPAEAVRFEITQPGNANLTAALSVSPDGRKLAFIATSQNATRLWVRSLENLESRPLEGTDGVTGVPFWSLDSRYIVFNRVGKLTKIEAGGGPPLTLCDMGGTQLLGGFWTSDNKIVFSNAGVGLQQVPAGGGQASAFTKLDASLGSTHAFPSLLPDGRHFVYSQLSNSPETGGIYLGSTEGKLEQHGGKKLLADISPIAFASSPDPALGYILFVRGGNGQNSLGTLMAQPFDNRKLELSGDAVPVAEQVSNVGFSASATGVLVYGIGALNLPQGANNTVQGQLTWFDRDGKVVSTVGEPGAWQTLSLSPDNTKLAFSRGVQGNTDVWVYEFARGVTTRLTSNPALDFSPVWSADGSRIVFFSARNPPGLYQRASNGAGVEDLFFKEEPNLILLPGGGAWSRDGRFMALYSVPAGAAGGIGPETDLWLVPLGGAASGPGDRKAVPLLRTEFAERGARFSPDGRWFTYTSNKSGKDEAYVRAFDPAFVPGSGNPSPGGEFLISKDGGASPHWRGDGKEMYYLAPDGGVMSVDITTSPEFKAAVPKLLFKGPPRVVFWDVSNDGKRFLIPVAGGTVSGAPAPYKVVLNWTSTLKK